VANCSEQTQCIGHERERAIEIGVTLEPLPELGRAMPLLEHAPRHPGSADRPVAAAVVGDPRVATVGAGLDMSAKRRGPAVLDRRHHLELVKAQMPGTRGPIGGTGSAEDVGDVDGGAHAGQPSDVLPVASRSSGLVTARIVRVATLV
jgi:hypothetical protein